MPLNKRLAKRVKIHRRTLVLHEAIADKLIQHPHLISLAEECLERRYQQGLIRYGSYIVWQSLLPLLASDPKEFKQELLATDMKMEQLRRQTIFIGILSEEERAKVLATSASTLEIT